jgi:hypothetical protein
MTPAGEKRSYTDARTALGRERLAACFGNPVATYPGTETGFGLQKVSPTIPLVNGQSTPLPPYDDGDGNKCVLPGCILVSAGP